jgi:hypothetical protein
LIPPAWPVIQVFFFDLYHGKPLRHLFYCRVCI